jgi:DNA-binding GntR family transcriptional regulator
MVGNRIATGPVPLDKNLREKAYDRLRKRLFSGDYRPGAMVSLSRLSELSEMPIAATREAVQWLEYDGMVRIFPKRGIQIAEVNVEFVRETFQVRMIFEKEGARRLAEIGRDQDFDAMEAMTREDMELVRTEVSDRTMKQISRTNVAFHAYLIRILNSREIERLHAVNQQRIAFINQNVNLPPGGEFVASMKEHLEIIASLRARDGEAAAHAVETHLSSALRRVMSL